MKLNSSLFNHNTLFIPQGEFQDKQACKLFREHISTSRAGGASQQSKLKRMIFFFFTRNALRPLRV